MARADGLIVEIHEQPQEAFSDGEQSLAFTAAKSLFEKIMETVEFKKRLSLA